MRLSAVSLVMILCSAGLAQAGEDTAPAAACPSPNSGLPETLAGWGKDAAPMATAHDVKEAAKTPLPLGQRIAFKLANTSTIHFAHRPGEQMPKQYVYSGMIGLRLPKTGTYTVMISEANWVDIVQGGKLIDTLEMGKRLLCAKYGKKLEFPLKAGTAYLQFFGAPYETVDIMVAPAP